MNLIRDIKKLQKWAEQATEYDKQNETALGYAADTLDTLYEIVNESIPYIEELLEDEDDDEWQDEFEDDEEEY